MLGCIQPISSPMMNRMLGFDCCCPCATLGPLNSDADRSEAPINPINRRPHGASFIDPLHDQIKKGDCTWWPPPVRELEFAGRWRSPGSHVIVDAGEVRRRPRVVSYWSVGRRPNYGLSGENLYLGGGIADAPPKGFPAAVWHRHRQGGRKEGFNC